VVAGDEEINLFATLGRAAERCSHAKQITTSALSPDQGLANAPADGAPQKSVCSRGGSFNAWCAGVPVASLKPQASNHHQSSHVVADHA